MNKTWWILSFCLLLILNTSTCFCQEKEDPFLKAMLELKGKTGRDNALIYYAQASTLGLPHVDSSLLKQCLEEGWAPKFDSLIPLFKDYKPAFDLVRKGVALDFAEFPPETDPPAQSPIPNFLITQTLSRMLCAEGKYYESKNGHLRALDNYLLAAKFGKDFACQNSTLISGIIAHDLLENSYNCLAELIESGKLREKHWDRIMETLELIEKRAKTYPQYLESEFAYGIHLIEFAESNSDSFTQKELDRLNIDKKDIPKLLEELKSLQKRVKDFKAIPYWERNPYYWNGIEQDIEISQNPFKDSILQTSKYEPRFLKAKAKEALLKTMVEIEKYKNQNKKYPKRLQFLSEEYQNANIIDPFSGKPLMYEPDPRGTYFLYSVGPDKEDNQGILKYSSKNNLEGPGDIYF